MRKVFILLLLILACVQTEAQPRIRVIVDNDFGGDPDGLFQLAHQVCRLLLRSEPLSAVITTTISSATLAHRLLPVRWPKKC